MCLCFVGIEQQPGPEAANVAVRDPAAVVELEHRPLVGHRLVPETTGHPQVDEQYLGMRIILVVTLRIILSLNEPQHEVLPSAFHRGDTLSGQPRGDPVRLIGSREARIVNSGDRDAAAFDAFRQTSAFGFDLRELGHGPTGYPIVSSTIRRGTGGSSPTSYAASTSATAASAAASSAAYTSPSTSPAVTSSPRFFRQRTPTA